MDNVVPIDTVYPVLKDDDSANGEYERRLDNVFAGDFVVEIGV